MFEERMRDFVSEIARLAIRVIIFIVNDVALVSAKHRDGGRGIRIDRGEVPMASGS